MVSRFGEGEFLILINQLRSSHDVGNTEQIVRNADFTMYEAKRSDRSCSVPFSEAMHARMARHLAIETSLWRAIGTQEIFLAYVPVVELQTGCRRHVDAVLHWNHPTMGSIASREFLPIAQESGLMVALGQSALAKTCLAMASWLRADTQSASDRICLCISRSELSGVDRYIEEVRGILRSGALPAVCQSETW